MLKQYLLRVYQLVGQVVNVVLKKIRKRHLGVLGM